MSTPNASSNKQLLETRYNNSRTNLLIVVVFTVINLILLVMQSNVYFLFSAFIPYALTDVGMALSGMYPMEYYGEDFSDMAFLDSSIFALLFGIAVIITILYLISWFFSKNNRYGWMIFALIIFAIDTVGMFTLIGFQIDSIIDIVFHVWVIVSLALGINAASKLKNLPEDKIDVPDTETQQTEETAKSMQGSDIIRTADPNVKSRILLEANVLGHAVTYRRVKRVNELVIDGNVYDEIEALVEFSHSLSARVDDHVIEAGFNGKFHSYLKLDGELIVKKLRLY